MWKIFKKLNQSTAPKEFDQNDINMSNFKFIIIFIVAKTKITRIILISKHIQKI
jgi:hypothetical protein